MLNHHNFSEVKSIHGNSGFGINIPWRPHSSSHYQQSTRWFLGKTIQILFASQLPHFKTGWKSPDSFTHNKHKLKKKWIWKHFKSPLPKSQNQILAEKAKESKLTTMRFCYFPHPLCLFPWRWMPGVQSSGCIAPLKVQLQGSEKGWQYWVWWSISIILATREAGGSQDPISKTIQTNGLRVWLK
jgi:hypothetical protein